MPVSDAASLTDDAGSGQQGPRTGGPRPCEARAPRRPRPGARSPRCACRSPRPPSCAPCSRPRWTGVQPVRSQLLELVSPLQMSPDCGFAKAVGFGYLIADLALIVMGDGGGIDIDLGGARAGTDATTYVNPLDSGFGAITPPGLPAGAATARHVRFPRWTWPRRPRRSRRHRHSVDRRRRPRGDHRPGAHRGDLSIHAPRRRRLRRSARPARRLARAGVHPRARRGRLRPPTNDLTIHQTLSPARLLR